MLCMVLRLWLPIPYWDEWDTPGNTLVRFCAHTLDFTTFWEQHNESRKLFPRLLYLGLAQFGGWDVRKEMVLLFLSVCLSTALFFRLVRGMRGASLRLALISWVAACFLLFSPAQVEN